MYFLVYFISFCALSTLTALLKYHMPLSLPLLSLPLSDNTQLWLGISNLASLNFEDSRWLMGQAQAQAQAQSPTPPHLYPQALQLKLYQAFIFSIPILFSIILFLLFYLFYLKRRASNLSIPRAILPTTLNQATPYLSSPCQLSPKKEVTDKLPTVLFDEELLAKDTQCSVCLGEFEMREELLQVPSCKHVFHVECMHHWLHSNSTCPLCRCSVSPIPTIHTEPPPPS